MILQEEITDLFLTFGDSTVNISFFCLRKKLP